MGNFLMWSEDGPIYIIAEAGSNHDGSFLQAKELIEHATEAKCDAVKFQCIPPFERDWVQPLQDVAEVRGLDFLATPFDVDAVRFLADVGVPLLKIASPEIVNLPLVEAAANTGKPLLLSTGMANLGEISAALKARDLDLAEQDVALLHCTTRYPTPPAQVNLNAMETLRFVFGFPVGLSDHSEGIAIPIAAAALGARIIEKHFTLDKTLEGPDHHYALEPEELRQMVEGVRQVEQALGTREKGPQEGELVEARGRQLEWTS
jgi:N,N'-diacetyllegionaminate synthase